MFKATYPLFFGKPFEFYSAYSIEEATRQLHIHSQRHKRKPLSWRKTYQLLLVEVDENDKNTYHFKGNQEVGKNFYVIFSGDLYRRPSGIAIKGAARPGFLTLIFPLIFLIGWSSLFISLSHGLISLMLLILGLVVTIATYLAIINSRNKMINTLHSILENIKQD